MPVTADRPLGTVLADRPAPSCCRSWLPRKFLRVYQPVRGVGDGRRSTRWFVSSVAVGPTCSAGAGGSSVPLGTRQALRRGGSRRSTPVRLRPRHRCQRPDQSTAEISWSPAARVQRIKPRCREWDGHAGGIGAIPLGGHPRLFQRLATSRLRRALIVIIVVVRAWIDCLSHRKPVHPR